MTIQERLFRDFHLLMGGSNETFKAILEEDRRMKDVTPRPHQGLAPYRPPGDGDMRDSMLKVIDAWPDHETGLALYFLVDGMDTLAKYSMTPSAKRMAAAYADAFRHLIPADVADLFKRAKAGKESPTRGKD
jgi:hypothetical protein